MSTSCSKAVLLVMAAVWILTKGVSSRPNIGTNLNVPHELAFSTRGFPVSKQTCLFGINNLHVCTVHQ